MPDTPPEPLTWHPAYRGHMWLWDWLNGVGLYADQQVVRIPVLSTTVSLVGDLSPRPSRTHVLTRRRCWGLAPYVGEPFVYTWCVATDQLGRAVAGEARTQPVPSA